MYGKKAGMHSLSPFFSRLHTTEIRVESFFFSSSSSSETTGSRHHTDHTSELNSDSNRRICCSRKNGKQSVWRWCSQWCNIRILSSSFLSSFCSWNSTHRLRRAKARKADRHTRKNGRQEAEKVTHFRPLSFSSLEECSGKEETYYGSQTAWDDPLPMYPSFASRECASSRLTSLSFSTAECSNSIPSSLSTAVPFSSSSPTAHSSSQLSEEKEIRSTRSSSSEQKLEDSLHKRRDNEEKGCDDHRNLNVVLASPNALLDTNIQAKDDWWSVAPLSVHAGDAMCSHEEPPKTSLEDTSSSNASISTADYDALHRLHDKYNQVACTFFRREREDVEPSKNYPYRGNTDHKCRTVELERIVCPNILSSPTALSTLEQKEKSGSENERQNKRRWNGKRAERRTSAIHNLESAMSLTPDLTIDGPVLAGLVPCVGHQMHCFVPSGKSDVEVVNANACTTLFVRLQEELQRQERSRTDAFGTTAVASRSRERIWAHEKMSSLSLYPQHVISPSLHSSPELSSLSEDSHEENVTEALQSEKGRNVCDRRLTDEHWSPTLWHPPSVGYPRRRQRQIRSCYRNVFNALCKEKVAALVKRQYQMIYDTESRFVSEMLQRRVLQLIVKKYPTPASDDARSPSHIVHPAVSSTPHATADDRNEERWTCSGVLRHIRENIPAPIGFLRMDASDEEWRRECQQAARTSPGKQPTELFLGGLCVSFGQLSSLINSGDWLNDQVINAYLDLLSRRSGSTRKEMHIGREEKTFACGAMHDNERSGIGQNNVERRSTEGTLCTAKRGNTKVVANEKEVLEKDREVASLGTHFYAKVLTELEKESHTFSETYTSIGNINVELFPSSLSSAKRVCLSNSQGADTTAEEDKRQLGTSFSFSTPLSLSPLSPNSGLLRWFRRRRYLLLPYRSSSTVPAAVLAEEEAEEEEYSSIRLVLIPVNLSNIHWVLVVWDKEKREFVLYDSMCSDHAKHLEKHYKVLLVIRHVLQACFHHFFGFPSSFPKLGTKRWENTQSRHRSDHRHVFPFTVSHFPLTGVEKTTDNQQETFFHVEEAIFSSQHVNGVNYRGPSSRDSRRSLWNISSHTLFVAFPLRPSGFFTSCSSPCASQVPRRVEVTSGPHSYSSSSSPLDEQIDAYSEEKRNDGLLCSREKKDISHRLKIKERESGCVSLLDIPSHWCAPQQRNGSDCGVFVCLAAWCLAQGVAVTFPTSVSAISFFRIVMGMELWCNKLLTRMVSGFGEKRSTETVSSGTMESENRNTVEEQKDRGENEDGGESYKVFHELSQEMSSSSIQIACSPHFIKG